MHQVLHSTLRSHFLKHLCMNESWLKMTYISIITYIAILFSVDCLLFHESSAYITDPKSREKPLIEFCLAYGVRARALALIPYWVFHSCWPTHPTKWMQQWYKDENLSKLKSIAKVLILAKVPESVSWIIRRGLTMTCGLITSPWTQKKCKITHPDPWFHFLYCNCGTLEVKRLPRSRFLFVFCT